MAEAGPEREMWLVAAWPGLGNVGVGAAAYLLGQLDAKLTHEIPPRDVFDLDHIDVAEGLARAGRLPRSVFFEWQDPKSPRDLLIFVGEAQPSRNGYTFCHRIMDYAISRNVQRVITFAAMATQLHPSDEPRAFGLATNGEGIRDLQGQRVTLLKEGQITGLNGVLIAVAAERDIPGLCLLGELPFFAAAVPNPGASKVVLDVFLRLSGITIDLEALEKQAQNVRNALLQMLAKLQEESPSGGEPSEQESEFGQDDEASSDEDSEPADASAEPAASASAGLDLETRRRIESLFQAAAQDHAKAFQLKKELDRLNAFKQYEDRFLDLFRKGQ